MKAPELKEKLQESEKLIQEMTVTWEEKLRKTEEIATVRTSAEQILKLIQCIYMRYYSVIICVLTGAAEAAREHGYLFGNIWD